MPAPACTDEEFRAAWAKYGSPQRVASEIGMSVRRVYARKEKLGLETWNDTSDRRLVLRHDEGRIDYSIDNGVVIVFSDAHYWPNQRTTCTVRCAR